MMRPSSVTSLSVEGLTHDAPLPGATVGHAPQPTYCGLSKPRFLACLSHANRSIGGLRLVSLCFCPCGLWGVAPPTGTLLCFIVLFRCVVSLARGPKGPHSRETLWCVCLSSTPSVAPRPGVWYAGLCQSATHRPWGRVKRRRDCHRTGRVLRSTPSHRVNHCRDTSCLLSAHSGVNNQTPKKHTLSRYACFLVFS